MSEIFTMALKGVVKKEYIKDINELMTRNFLSNIENKILLDFMKNNYTSNYIFNGGSNSYQWSDIEELKVYTKEVECWNHINLDTGDVTLITSDGAKENHQEKFIEDILPVVFEKLDFCIIVSDTRDDTYKQFELEDEKIKLMYVSKK